MAQGTSPRDIEAIYNAVRLRLSQAGSPSASPGGNVGPPGPPGPPGPKGVVWKGAWTLGDPYSVGDIVTNPSPLGCGGQLLTYFCLFDEEANATNEPVPGGTPGYWWELTNGTLVIDGTRAMACDLDMAGFDINNVEVIRMLGQAKVEDAVWIEMNAGATDTRITNLDRIEFDTVDIHLAHTYGAFHWDPEFLQPIADSASDSGPQQIPMASVYVMAYNVNSEATIFAGEPVRGVGADSSSVQITHADATTPSARRNVLGIAAQEIDPGGYGWVCVKGMLRGPDFSGTGVGIAYLDENSPAGLTTSPPNSNYKGCTWTVRMGYVMRNDSESEGWMFVDVERIPGVQELSDVATEDANPPECGDVLVRQVDPGTGCGQWAPSGLWTEVVFDFGPTDVPGDVKVFTVVGDPRVKLSSIITMAPSAKPVAPRQEDEAEFDCFVCSCVPTVEQPTFDDPPSEFRAYVHSIRGRVVGQYRFQYTVSNPASWNCVFPGIPS